LVKLIHCILNALFPIVYSVKIFYCTIYPFTCLTIEKGQGYKSGKSGGQNCVLNILSPETLSIQLTEYFEVLQNDIRMCVMY